jgi:hypothetical protein
MQCRRVIGYLCTSPTRKTVSTAFKILSISIGANPGDIDLKTDEILKPKQLL